MRKLTKAAFRECTSPSCGFRYPDIEITHSIVPCPCCGKNAEIIHSIDLTESSNPSTANNVQTKNIICVLDNIRSVYNVGSLFRTMAGFGIAEAILGGITPTPLHKSFRKTSMGAEDDMHWHSVNNAYQLCQSLKDDGYHLIALETNTEAKSINLYERPDADKSIVFIVGNEITGIDPSILKNSDQILSIPIKGRNKSYNVTVALGIGLYACLSIP